MSIVHICKDATHLFEMLFLDMFHVIMLPICGVMYRDLRARFKSPLCSSVRGY